MHWTRTLLAASLTVLVAACGAGPSLRPGVAVRHPPGSGPATQAHPAVPPGPQRPVSDLPGWHDCAGPTFTRLGLGSPPGGLIFECTEYTTPIDSGGSIIGTFATAVARARSPQTPADAPPVILTSGNNESSIATLAGLAAGGSDAMAAHPIVAVDRRGTGGSQPIDCIPSDARRGLADAGQFTPEGGDPIDAVAKYGRDATVACQDFLQPYQGTFDAPHAADDIEELRRQWHVDRIALWGTGNGARVAMSYAAKFGDHLARLIVDSPEPVGVDAVTRAQQRVEGSEAALSAFAQRCAAVNCALGADPRATIADIVRRAGTGGVGDVSAAALVSVITQFLGDPQADQANHVTDLADAIAGVGRGDRGPFDKLVQRQSAGRSFDGWFVTDCSDSQQPATPPRAKELATQWDGRSPVFGKVTAAWLMTCTAWPVSDAPPLPTKLDLPVLVLGTAADPVTGGAGRPSVTGALNVAGARTATVEWQGWGHPVVPHSRCAQQYLTRYLTDATLPDDGTACPA